MHEALLSREEFLKSEDMGDYYRIKADTRDLNYAKYFEEGDQEITKFKDYTSENTTRLTKNQMIEMLLKLEFIQNELNQ